jgi:hypothetical protein
MLSVTPGTDRLSHETIAQLHLLHCRYIAKYGMLQACYISIITNKIINYANNHQPAVQYHANNTSMDSWYFTPSSDCIAGTRHPDPQALSLPVIGGPGFQQSCLVGKRKYHLS